MLLVLHLMIRYYLGTSQKAVSRAMPVAALIPVSNSKAEIGCK